MRRVVFRADGSPTLGLGHLSRCVVLARALARRGVEVDFLSARDGADGAAWLADRGVATTTLDAARGSDEDAELTAARLRSLGAGLLVVDGYAFDGAYLARVADAAWKRCVVDDLGDRELDCDAVLNPNAHGAAVRYRTRPFARLLVGPDYALVDDAFAQARARKATPSARAERLLVTLGGSDPTEATELAVVAVRRAARFHARIVVGPTNPRRERLARAGGEGLDVVIGASGLAPHMEWADVALTSGGGTCLELACVGVPAAAIVVADNQRPGVAALGAAGALRALGDQKDVDEESMARALVDLACDVDGRRNMVEAQRRIVDGRGADRAAAELEALAWRRS